MLLKTHGHNLDSLIEGFQIISYDWYYLYVNDAVVKQSKYSSKQELQADSIFVLYPGIEKTPLFEILEKCMKQRVARNFEHEFTFPDNSKGWFEMRVEPVPEGLFILSMDITDRKKADMALLKSEERVRQFAKHLNEVLEAERANLAREIHDELGQQLAGIKMGIASVKKILPPEKITGEYFEDIIHDIDNTIQSLRKIATELRPGILDTLGLIPSLEWLVKEFARKNPNIKPIFKSAVSDFKFDSNLSTCFFRVCQETLTNVTKHAHASEVLVEIKQADKSLRLSVVDNGKGISEEKLENPFSVGLLGMRERAVLVGAQLNIKSKKGEGTCIELIKN